MDHDSLSNSRWHKRIVQVGYADIMDSIQRSCVFHGSASGKYGALGIVAALNKGLQKKMTHAIEN